MHSTHDPSPSPRRVEPPGRRTRLGRAVTLVRTGLRRAGWRPSRLAASLDRRPRVRRSVLGAAAGLALVSLTAAVADARIAAIARVADAPPAGSPHAGPRAVATHLIRSSVGAPALDVTSGNPGPLVARDHCLRIAVTGTIARECDDLVAWHALPSVTTRGETRTPLLVYNSQHAAPHPVVHADVTLPTTGSLPQSIRVTLTINGASDVRVLPTTLWGAPGATAGVVRRASLGVDATTWPTGVYSYEVRAESVDSTGATPSGASIVAQRALVVVNREASEFGSGWWLGGVERLLPVPAAASLASADSLLWVGGDGSARVYVRRAAGDSVFLAPLFDRPDSLTRHATGTFDRWLPGGASAGGPRVTFDAAGRHAQTVDRLGQATTVSYDGAGRVSQLAVPPASAGLTYTFAYDTTSGRLARVTAPPLGGTARAVAVQMYGRHLRRFTDVDSLLTYYEYFEPTAQLQVYVPKTGSWRYFSFNGAGQLQTASWWSEDTYPGPSGHLIAHYFATVEGSPGVPLAVDPAAWAVWHDGPRTDVTDRTYFTRDRFGGVTVAVDALGDSTVVAYDPTFPGLARSTRTPTGLVSEARYNVRGLPDSVWTVDPLGTGGTHASADAVTTYVYGSAFPTPTQVTTPTGVVTERSVDAGTGNVLWEQTGGSTYRTTFGYATGTGADAGLLTSVTRALGSVETLRRDTLGNVRLTQTPRGATTLVFRDAVGRDTLTITPTVLTTTGGASDSARTRAVGRRVRAHYDVMDRVTDQWTETGPSVATADADTLHVQTRYDAEGRDTTVTRRAIPDRAGVGPLVTRRRYDGVGRLVAAVAADGLVDSTTYDPAGNVVATRTRRGYALTMTYDALNRLATRAVPGVTYGPEARSLPTALFAGTRPAKFPYFGVTSAGAPFVFDQVADSGATPPDLVLAAETTVFHYDQAGRLDSAKNNDAIVTRSYYPNGLLKRDRVRLAVVDTLVTAVTSEADRYAHHDYRLHYTYDLDGRRLTRTDTLPDCAGGCVQTYQYQPSTGWLDSTSQQGNRFRLVYDAEGRLTGRTARGPTATADDAASSFDYDADSRMRQRDVQGNGVQVYFDTLGYDDANRVVASLTTSALGGIGEATAPAYRAVGPLEHMSRVRASTTVYDDYVTDAFGNQALQARRLGGTAVPAATDTSFYDRERLTKVAGVPGPWSSSNPPPSDDVATADTTTHTYDGAGNRRTTAVVRWRFTSGSSAHWEAVADGREWVWNAYGADDRLRVTQRSFFDANVAGTAPHTAFLEYRYDPMGRRVQTRTRWDLYCTPAAPSTGSQAASLPTTCRPTVDRTVWDGDQVLVELRNAAAVFTTADTLDTCPIDVADESCASNGFAPRGETAVPRPGSYERRTAGDPEPEFTLGDFSGTVRYTHADGVDDPLALVKSGITVGIVPHRSWRGLYEAGSYLGASSVSPTWPARNRDAFHAPDSRADVVAATHWLGSLVEDKLEPSGLQYLRNRYYDPTSGRFTQEDPIGLAGGLNLYGYAGADPVNLSDPFGLCPEGDFVCELVNQIVGVVQAMALGQVAEAFSAGMSAASEGVQTGGAAMAEARVLGGRTASQIGANAARGAAFEAKVAAQVEAEGWAVGREVTLQTTTGVRTRMDIVATRGGAIRCIECKSSATAPLTANQALAHPLIGENGATVVGRGKPNVPGGTKIPPTLVEVIRP